LTSYQTPITPGNPNGNLTLLPCTTPANQVDPKHWLCFNPGDICDTTDNNCNGQVDEGQTQCGHPLHCPQPETCNGLDDNCDGIVDNGGVCGTCPYQPPQQETCDGCDQNCDGIADNGIATQPCGLTGPGEPRPPQLRRHAHLSAPSRSHAGSLRGADRDLQRGAAGRGLRRLGQQPATASSTTTSQHRCVPANAPPGLNYGPNSQCKMGQTQLHQRHDSMHRLGRPQRRGL